MARAKKVNLDIPDETNETEPVAQTETVIEQQDQNLEPEEPATDPEPEEPANDPEPEEPVNDPEPEEPATDPEPEEPAADPEPEEPAGPQAVKFSVFDIRGTVPPKDHEVFLVGNELDYYKYLMWLSYCIENGLPLSLVRFQ
ncbi:MAG TPA: hypothetical protein VGN64_04230 [Dyadobacter sp.]|jgi:hypothetical protein|nr:hypothetical protein [Dyadobacter sp.]